MITLRPSLRSTEVAKLLWSGGTMRRGREPNVASTATGEIATMLNDHRSYGGAAALRTASSPWRARSMASARTLAASCGAWKPIEFSAAMKSSRHWACLCSSSLGLSCSSQASLFWRRQLRRSDPEGLATALEQLLVAILNDVDARFDLLLREVMARLTGAVDVEHRAAATAARRCHCSKDKARANSSCHISFMYSLGRIESPLLLRRRLRRRA